MVRCPWCMGSERMQTYHDKEWGTPVHDERKHFEFLLLESMQAGLSWMTILNKRENFRKAFHDFDPVKIACYDNLYVEELCAHAGIIRNRRKIEAAINNAKRFLEIREEFSSFDRYMWGFVNYKPVHNTWKDQGEIPVTTQLSDTMSRDLKKRGFKFVGSTTIYAHIQAIGVVNDHLVTCFRHKELSSLSQ